MPERILYLPIIEPGAHHQTALRNKRGLCDALNEYGGVYQWDYLEHPWPEICSKLTALVDSFNPDLLVTQFHGADDPLPDTLSQIRQAHPNLKCVNWSGDSWLHSLTSPAMLNLCRNFDLQLVAAPDVLPIYEKEGIPAHFWQIAYEAPVGPLPDVPAYDVVFLGNVISDKRRALLEWLRSLSGIKVGIYGDWEHADGNCLYDFAFGDALYKKARLAIADLAYVDQKNYVSNRPIQIMMAGGAVLLHEQVEKMDVLLGIEDCVHYFAWDDFDYLGALIQAMLHTDRTKQVNMARKAQEFAAEHHTYKARVKQLFEEWLK